MNSEQYKNYQLGTIIDVGFPEPAKWYQFRKRYEQWRIKRMLMKATNVKYVPNKENEQ